jgi:hypothetical protein
MYLLNNFKFSIFKKIILLELVYISCTYACRACDKGHVPKRANEKGLVGTTLRVHQIDLKQTQKRSVL